MIYPSILPSTDIFGGHKKTAGLHAGGFLKSGAF